MPGLTRSPWATARGVLAAAVMAGTLALALSPALAREAFGVSFPETMTLLGRTLTLNGVGLRTLTIFHVRAYAAGLYVEHPTHDADAILRDPGPKVVFIRFLHDGSKERVEDAFRNGARRTCGDAGCPPEETAQLERLIQAFPLVNAGDTATYKLSKNGVDLLFNDKPLMTIPSTAVAQRILLSFVGPNPPSEDLRAGMLGLATE